MNKFVSILVLAVLLFSCGTNSWKNSLEKDFSKFSSLSEANNYRDILAIQKYSLLPTDISNFTEADFNKNKKNMEEYQKVYSSYNTLKTIGNVIEKDNTFYTKISYMNTTKIKVYEKNGFGIEALKQASSSLCITSDFIYDYNSDTYTVKCLTESIAASKDGKNNWKFASINPQTKQELKKFVPSELLE